MNKQTTVTIDQQQFTPEKLAEMFWDLDDSQQARFFGHLGAITLGEHGGYQKLDMQMCYVSEANNLTPNGARVMEIIGAFVEGKRLQPIT